MNLIKACLPPTNYSALKILSHRMRLNPIDRHYLRSYLKGYLGQKILEEKASILHDHFYVLSDLYFKPKYSSASQIDMLIGFGRQIYLYEVKHYYGHYFYGKQEFTREDSTYTLRNPEESLKEKVWALKKILEEQNLELSIQPFLVFTNSDFSLKELPRSAPIILENQIDAHFDQLNQKNDHSIDFKNTAQILLDESSSSFLVDNYVPHYDFENLKRGLHCGHCKSLDINIYRKSLFCQACELKSMKNETIIQNIRDYHITFPNRELSYRNLQDWLGKDVMKSSLYHALKSYKESLYNH